MSAASCYCTRKRRLRCGQRQSCGAPLPRAGSMAPIVAARGRADAAAQVDGAATATQGC